MIAADLSSQAKLLIWFYSISNSRSSGFGSLESSCSIRWSTTRPRRN